jgi:hypothetical protein
MNEYIICQVYPNIKSLNLKFQTHSKENAISVLKKFQEINRLENEDNVFEVFTKVKI